MTTEAKELENKTPEWVGKWLTGLLDGTVMLPNTTRDDTVDSFLLRLEPKLSPPARNNLLTAVAILFLGRLHQGGFRLSDSSLCNLIVRLKLTDVASHVPTHVMEVKAFEAHPFNLRVALLHVITDLQVEVPTGFWQSLSARDSGKYAILAVSALLRSNPVEAIALFPQLPNDERVADALQVLWDIRVEEAPQEEWLRLAREVRPECQPLIQAAIDNLSEVQEDRR